MKKLNSKRIIIFGMFLGILFSLLTYQNFSHNIEEIIEEQEFKSNNLTNNNVQIIFDKINSIIKNTIQISLDDKIFNAIEKNDIQKIENFSSLLQKRLSSSYDVNSIHFISSKDKNLTTDKKFTSCFTLENDTSFYKINYPVYLKDIYMGSFEIRLDNQFILKSIKEYIDAEIGLFVKETGILKNKELINSHSFGDYIITNTTNNKFIELMLQHEDFSIEDSEEIFHVDDKLIEIDSISLSDKDKILVLFHDVTETYENIKDTKYDFILYFIILLCIFLLISYYISFNSNKTISKQYNELVLKKEESEKLLKVKSEFLANMSHEIRTPLNAINGFIDLIEEQSTDANILKYINTIQHSSKSLLHIIEDILDLSKIESGKMSITKIDFDTKYEFETIAYLFDTKLSTKNLLINLNIDENLPRFLNSDSLRIKQVISNLIDNAIKFTDKGKEIIVDISYSDNHLNVSVEDEGIGIIKERQKRIFQPFTQADNSTTRKYGGTGLGLTISSQLVKLLGGKLKLKSEINQGSKFYFSIPVAIGKEIIIEKDIEKTTNFVNKKILLVEDNKSNQLFMQVILKKMELDFDIARDGIEAIEYFKNNKYNLILMDENMPNMSGIEATKEIIAIELEKDIKHTPIIALTANALAGDREKFLAAGMDEYLSKPINKNNLAKVLTTYFT